MNGVLNERIKNNTNIFDYSNIVPFPKNMLLEITNICNHRCIFCANSKMTRKKSFMNIEFGKRIMKQAYENGTREIGFYATGEPLVNKDLEEYIRYAKTIGYEYTYITTNGALLDRKRSESLIKSGIDSVKISFNASNAKDYFLIHGKDEFDKVRFNIIEFNELRKKSGHVVNLYLSCYLTNYTKEAGDGVKRIFGDIVDDIYIANCCNQSGYMFEIKDNIAVNGESGYHPNKDICPVIYNSLYVSVEGYLTLCCADFQNYLAIADLNKESIVDAWNNMYAQKLRELHLNHNLGSTLCANCINNCNSKVEALCPKLAIKFEPSSYDSTAAINERIRVWKNNVNE